MVASFCCCLPSRCRPARAPNIPTGRSGSSCRRRPAARPTRWRASSPPSSARSSTPRSRSTTVPAARSRSGSIWSRKSRPTATPSAWGRSARSPSPATWWRSCPIVIERDFQPIALVARGHLLLAVSPKLPVKSVAELIDYAKNNPGKLSNASSSNGSPGHVGGELFKYMTGTEIVHVPYKGGAAAIQDLIAGRVQLMFESLNPDRAACACRHGAGARGRQRSSLGGVPRSADHRGGRRAGLRGRHLDRRHRAGRRAAADRRQAQRRDQSRLSARRRSRRVSR